jgi:hypothetical protein
VPNTRTLTSATNKLSERRKRSVVVLSARALWDLLPEFLCRRRTPKLGQESFQAWLQRYAPGFIDATTWEEFHGIGRRLLQKLLLRHPSPTLVFLPWGSSK